MCAVSVNVVLCNKKNKDVGTDDTIRVGFEAHSRHKSSRNERDGRMLDLLVFSCTLQLFVTIEVEMNTAKTHTDCVLRTGAKKNSNLSGLCCASGRCELMDTPLLFLFHRMPSIFQLSSSSSRAFEAASASSSGNLGSSIMRLQNFQHKQYAS